MGSVPRVLGEFAPDVSKQEELKTLRKLSDGILSRAAGLPIQILIRKKRGLLARFANNGVHQNGFQDLSSYLIKLQGKTGIVFRESNDFSKDGIRKIISEIKSIIPTPEPFSVISSEIYPEVKEYFPFKVGEAPQIARKTIETATNFIRLHQATANGYFSAYERFFYLRDARGPEAFHPATAFRFGVTITQGAGKGYLSSYHPDLKKIQIAPIVEEAMELAKQTSQKEITLGPGTYEVIFSPRAFLELLEPLRRHFDRRFKRSVLAESRGKKIFSGAFNLWDDFSRTFGVPFDGEGHARKKVELIKKGVLNDFIEVGHSTRGILDHPFYPQNLVVGKGNLSVSSLFKRVKRGIYINKIWYHTLVRENVMEVTGLATAGSAYIEDGKIRGRLVHLRYHDSLFDVLNSIRGTSREQILLKDGEMGSALLPYVSATRLKVV